ncbi:MAG: glucosaminidase domain-containing protein [Saprospiraceae bacterium]|nr:glucosaminidase domain-containing protein [Saprospiraceae bacterium]
MRRSIQRACYRRNVSHRYTCECYLGSGTSRIILWDKQTATEANNHFGIKCKTYWTGRTYYHKDDDLNKKGQLIESCFRAYERDIDSYIDRSNFLAQTERYAMLFEYENTDYMAWAYGLKVCGYATDENYAQKLIEKIKKYNLDKFDTSEDPFKLLIRK